jgi:hypothetical protein
VPKPPLSELVAKDDYLANGQRMLEVINVNHARAVISCRDSATLNFCTLFFEELDDQNGYWEIVDKVER